MKQIAIITTVIILTYSCNEIVNEQPKIELSDIEFESIFGTDKNNENNIYCLLGTGFFRTPRSDNSDSLINSWIKTHPNSQIIPVASHGPIQVSEPASRMIYSWIVDDGDTLNTFLIKNGCFPGGTMMRPNTWDEMAKWQKELYESKDEIGDIKVYMAEDQYQIFLNSIEQAEIYAKTNKLGIWKNEEIHQ